MDGRSLPDPLPWVKDEHLLAMHTAQQRRNKVTQHKAWLKEAETTHGEKDPRTLAAVHKLGTLLQDLGELEEAKPHLLRALTEREKALGETDWDTIESRNNFGKLLHEMGELKKAEPFCRLGSK